MLLELFGTPYSETILGALEHAILGSNDEYRALEEVVDGRLTGVSVFGLVAGTIGTGRILFVAGGSQSLIEQTLSDLAQHAVRLVIAELPEDRPFDRMRKLLLESGFQEESRVPDFYRPGVAQTFLRIVIPQERA